MEVRDRLKKALEAIEYLPNATYAWEKAHGSDRRLAERNAVKVQRAEDLLSEVLASLPEAVEYVVFGIEHHPLRFAAREEMVGALKRYGIQQTGVEKGVRLKPELRGQPTFDKLVGPMADRPGFVRYETAEVYERLSR